MKTYFILSNNTDFFNDIREVNQCNRKKCKETDGFILFKKVEEQITRIQTLNSIDELKSIVKNSKVYDYTGIETIIRIGEQIMTFNQYKNSK